MRLAHEIAETRDIPGEKCLTALHHALVLRNDMAATHKDGWRKISRVLFKLLNRDVAQSPDAWIPLCENPHPFIAFFAAAVVFAPGVSVLHHRVPDDEPHVF